MRLLAIDIETTHHDHRYGDVIQIAAIIFDAETGKPEPDHFDRLINPGIISGDAFCLAMHQKLFRRMSVEKCYTQDEALEDLFNWLRDKGFSSKNKAIPVGFNVASFDVNWLRSVEDSPLPISHRSVELGTLLMRKGVDFAPIPSAEAIKLLGTIRTVYHTALEDCRDAIAIYKLALEQ